MWVFDGEKWTEEGGSSTSTDQSRARQQQQQQQYDMLLPELQVVEVEITHINPRTNHVPPYPMP